MVENGGSGKPSREALRENDRTAGFCASRFAPQKRAIAVVIVVVMIFDYSNRLFPIYIYRRCEVAIGG